MILVNIKLKNGQSNDIYIRPYWGKNHTCVHYKILIKVCVCMVAMQPFCTGCLPNSVSNTELPNVRYRYWSSKTDRVILSIIIEVT